MIVLYILLPLVVFISLLYLFLIMPRNVHRADMTSLSGRVYAHRGMFCNTEIPENSMAAFARAVEHNYGIELDLHLTADAQIVVFHDKTMKRVCGIDNPVEEYTYDELKNVRLFNTDERIPLFSDVLALVNGKIPLIVELKGTSFKDTALADAAYAMLKEYNGEYCIESFNPMLIRRIRKLDKKIPTGLLSTDFYKADGKSLHNLLFSMLTVNVFARPDFIAYNHKFDNNIPYRLCRTLFKPYTAAWTIRDSEQFGRCRKSYDMLICENLPDIENT